MTKGNSLQLERSTGLLCACNVTTDRPISAPGVHTLPLRAVQNGLFETIMAPKLSQVSCLSGVQVRQQKHLVLTKHMLSVQEEFDEAVKTNIEDFDMEVCDQQQLLLLA